MAPLLDGSSRKRLSFQNFTHILGPYFLELQLRFTFKLTSNLINFGVILLLKVIENSHHLLVRNSLSRHGLAIGVL